MASLFLSRRRSPEGEHGAGGKILRGRRVAPPASPYQRPPPPPLPSPLPAQPRNPSWLSGLLSGAGKLISSVFGSSPSSSNSDYSTDEDVISTSSEDEDIDGSAGELHELNLGGKKQELIRDYVEASSEIVPQSESKLAIEQLILQETFSRDECMKLTEILKSRVVEYPSAAVGENERRKEILNNTSGSAISFLGGHRSLNQNSELQDTIPHSPSILNTLSPGYSVLQATPDLRATAVMEAKKWLEEKKLSSSSNTSLDCGPCTLNTDMLHYGIEGQVGSPVDMAKSYMRSLPPWQSPSLCNVGFKTPPPSGMHLYKDEANATTTHSLPSSKFLKRSYLASGMWDTLDEIRRVRMKSANNLLAIPNYRQIDASSSLLDQSAAKISSAAEKRELNAEDHCTNEALVLPVDNAVELNHPTKASKATYVSVTSMLEETVNAGQSTNESTMPTTSAPNDSVMGSENRFSDPDAHILDENQASKLEEALIAGQPTNESTMPTTSALKDSIIGSETNLSDPDAHILDDTLDVEEPLRTQEEVSNFSLPNEYLVSASKPMENDGNPLSEAGMVSSEVKKSATLSYRSGKEIDKHLDRSDDVTNHKDVKFATTQTRSGDGQRLQADKSSQLTGVEETHPITDLSHHDGDVQMHKEAKASGDKIAVNGAPGEYNTNSDLESLSKGGPSPASSNINEQATLIPDGTSGLLSKVASDIPVRGSNTHTGKSPNGMRKKSKEQMPTETQLRTTRHGRKAVVRRGSRRVK